APFLVGPGEVHLDPRAVLTLPLDLAVGEDLRLVARRVDLDLEEVRRPALAGARGDAHRLAGGELRVHAGGRDADPLLAPALAQDVELRSVQQLAEHLGDLVAYDPGAVVGDRQAEAILGLLLDGDGDLRQDAGFLAGIERVVDR